MKLLVKVTTNFVEQEYVVEIDRAYIPSQLEDDLDAGYDIGISKAEL